MNIRIKIADSSYIHTCVKILQDSKIGEVYFSDDKKTTDTITNAVSAHELYVAVGENEECFGFIYYKSEGMLGSYPYLHIIAVKSEYRSRGIGRQLIKYFEDHASKYPSTKYFLTADDFNARAKRFYESLGYHCVGVLPDFYQKGVSCYLMMKSD